MNTTKDIELEELREANHRLKLTLDTAKQTHNDELEYYKEEIQIKDKGYTELVDKFKTVQNERKQGDIKYASLNAIYDASVEENMDLKNQLQQFQKTIEHLKTVQVDRQPFEGENDLKIQIDQLNIDLANTRDQLAVEVTKVLGMNDQITYYAGQVATLKDHLESREQYNTELLCRIKELENDKDELFVELQQAQLAQHAKQQENEDPSRRGNSLFSEVEERRLRVEEELAKQRHRLIRLTAENMDLKSRSERVQSRTGLIVRQLQAMERNDIDTVKEYKKLQSETIPIFNQYRDRIEALTAEYKRKLTQYRSGVQTPAMDELETIRAERDLLLGQKISLDQEIWEMRRDLKCARSKIREWEQRCMIFRTKLHGYQDAVRSGETSFSYLDRSLNGSSTTQNGSEDVNGNKNWFRDALLVNCSFTEEDFKSDPLSLPVPVSPPPPLDMTVEPKNIKQEKPARGRDHEELAECQQQ